MKKTFKLALVTLLSLSAFFACTKAEQTSMSIDDIEGKATISGILTYVAGQELTKDGSVKDLINPAADVTVVVNVSINSLDPWGNSTGYKTYTATTDADGMWSVDVPVVDNGAQVNVKASSFTGTYKTFDHIDAGQTIWKETKGIYEVAEYSLYDVTPGEQRFNTAQYTFSTSENEGETVGMARLKGTFTYNAGQSYSTSEGFYDLQNVASGVKVNVMVDGKPYQTTTNSLGVFDITVPVSSYGSSVTVNPQSFLGTYTTLETIRDGKFIWDEADVVYESNGGNYTVFPDEIAVCDSYYYHVESGAVEKLDATVPLKVRVGCGVSVRSADDIYTEEYIYNSTTGSYEWVDVKTGRYHLKGELKARSKVDVILTVKYDDYPVSGQTTYRNYCGTTNNNGEIDFNIPSKDVEWYDADIMAVARPFVVNNFYYYDEYNDYYTLSGIYEPYSAFDGYIDFEGLEGVTNIVTLRMFFEPFVGETYGYDADNYSSFWQYGSF